MLHSIVHTLQTQKCPEETIDCSLLLSTSCARVSEFCHMVTEMERDERMRRRIKHKRLKNI